MKITDSEVIKTGEKELIDTIIGDLDWNAIESIFKEKHHLRIQDDVEYRQGDIVVHNNQVAYQLDFDVKVTLSILFDRSGKYLSATTLSDVAESSLEEASSDIGEAQKEEPSSDTPIGLGETEITTGADPKKAPDENMSQMASQIAEMISEINEE